MKYTIWEQTPLKWHKFVTYIVLPLTGIAAVVLFIVSLTNLTSNWGLLDDATVVVSCVSIFYALGMGALVVVAIIGCLPNMRKWYGPLCVIIGYSLSAAYSLFCVAIYTHYHSSSVFINQNLDTFITSTVAAVLTGIYYKKRRALFSASKRKNTEARNQMRSPQTITEKEETQNSLELLAEIQAEAEQERMRASEPADPPVEADKAGKGRRLAVLAGVCVLGILCGTAIGYAISNSRVAALQAELANAREDYAAMKSARDAMRERVNQLSIEVGDYGDEKLKNLRKELFFSTNIGFVVSGSSYYHTYDCTVFRNADEYWVHKVDDCIVLGYDKCPLCH